jgi:membrane-associated protein
MGSIVDRVVDLNGLAIYLTVGAFVLAEDAVFVGFFVPGETVAILGGVAASRGHASFAGLCAIVATAAIVGDNIGYALGARYGERLLRTPVLLRRERRVREAQEMLRRHGGPAVFAGRFIAFLRAVTPFLAGVAHLRYRRFLVYIISAGVIWGVGSVLLGYLLGGSYRAAERVLGPATTGILAALVIVVLVAWGVRRRTRERRADERDRAKADRAKDDAAKADRAKADRAKSDRAAALAEDGEPSATEESNQAGHHLEREDGDEADARGVVRPPQARPGCRE